MGAATISAPPQFLNEMDQAAASFSTAVADLEYTKFTLVVNDRSTEKGKIYFEKRAKGPRVMIAFQQPSEKYVLFDGSKVQIYLPSIAQIDEYSVANNRGLMEQFLMLGFGTPASELQKSYALTFSGRESVDGEAALHLLLTPKNREVAARLSSIELWLSPSTYQPVQQKFVEPSGDYLIARYRQTQLNTKIPSKSFQLPVKGKVKIVRPQQAG